MNLQNMLQDLDTSNNYDELMQKLKDVCLIERTKQVYPDYNPKLLLSTIMVHKHGNDLHIPEELQSLAKDLWKSILMNSVCEEIYGKYIDVYLEWRLLDINELKCEIKAGIESLYEIKNSEVKDDGDEQWNEAIETSVHLMKEKINELEVYSKSPPSK